MITKYGYLTFGAVFLLCTALILLSFLIISSNFLKIAIITLSLLLIAFTLYFFRDPDRITPSGENIIISPADGEVIEIRNIWEERFLKANAIKISIFMSPLDVHVNRIPVSGRLDYFKYIEGKYLIARYEKASELNERAEYGISSNIGKILFTQVAGFIARRIVYGINKGDSVRIGERFGMIKFGSRVDIWAPENFKVRTSIGDKVRGGESILFELIR